MPERISEGYTEALNAIAEAGREIARAVAAVTATPPWIDAQEAAEQPHAPSGGNRTGGGLGERLRALGTGQTRSLRKDLREIADEVDRLEEYAHSLEERLGPLMQRMARVVELATEWEHGDPSQSTYGQVWRDAGHALRVAIDGPKNENEGA